MDIRKIASLIGVVAICAALGAWMAILATPEPPTPTRHVSATPVAVVATVITPEATPVEATPAPAPIEVRPTPTPVVGCCLVPGPAPDPVKGKPPVGCCLGAPVPVIPPARPVATAPRPNPPANSCPIPTWTEQHWVTTHPVQSWSQPSKVAPSYSYGTIPTGSSIAGCVRPDGWAAVTAFGWVLTSDI